MTDFIAATSPAADDRPRGWLALRVAAAATAATTAAVALRFCLFWHMLSMFHREGLPDPSTVEPVLRLAVFWHWTVVALAAVSAGAGVVAAWRSRGRFRAVAVMLTVAAAIVVSQLVAAVAHWQPAMWVFRLMGLKGA